LYFYTKFIFIKIKRKVVLYMGDDRKMCIKPTYEELEQLVKDLEQKNLANQIEGQQRQSKRDWRGTVDAINDWITLIDLDCIIIKSNRSVEKISQLRVQESIGVKCCDIAHESGNIAKDCPLPRMLQTKKRESADIQMGNGRWMHISVDPKFNKDGEMIGAVHIARDITEKIKIQEERELIQHERESLVIDLEVAMSKIKTLSGLIPICAHCKKIRDDKGYWNIIESYIETHSNAEFSHGMCPECADQLYGDEDWYSDMKEDKSQE
jgi:PAS domain S-box-containing protein